jgi:hypothetical protein
MCDNIFLRSHAYIQEEGEIFRIYEAGSGQKLN